MDQVTAQLSLDCTTSKGAGPGESYLHLGLLLVSISSHADTAVRVTAMQLSCLAPDRHSSPFFTPGRHRGQVPPPPSVDVRVITAHILAQHRVYKAVSRPAWHYQRYQVKVRTLNLTCLKIQAPRLSVTIQTNALCQEAVTDQTRKLKRHPDKTEPYLQP